MRWLIFFIFAFVYLALDRGLYGLMQHPPQFTLVLLIYVGLSASTRTAMWAAIVLGVLVDLSLPLHVAGQFEDFVLIGPAAIGYLVGAVAVMQLRGLVFRDSPIALAIMVFLIGILVQLVIVALISVRGLGINPADAIVNWQPADQLYHRFVQLLVTAVVAVGVSFFMRWTDRLWQFQ